MGGAPSTVGASPKQLAAAFAVQLANGCKQLLRASGTFPNDQTTYDFLLSKGLTAVQAAGVVGNLDQESGDSPSCYQGPNGCSSTPVAGYPGAGVAQWSVGQRWDTASMDNATWYANMTGQPLGALQTQLNFMWYELSTYPRYGLASLQAATTVPDAASAFASGFEACGNCVATNRNKYGQTAYNAFAGDAMDASASNGDGGMCTSYGACTNAGSPGSCIDSMTCTGKGGMPSGGHCPGPSNIECCTGM